MKRTQVLATLALAFMLGVAVPITAVTTISNAQAWAEETEAEPGSGNILLENLTDPQATDQSEVAPTAEAEDVIDTVEKLQAAINAANGGIVTLDTDITSESVIFIANDVTLNLNGHSITNTKGTAVNITKGNVNITGTGTLHGKGNALGLNGATEQVSGVYSQATVGQNVTLRSDTLYGIVVAPLNKGTNECYGVAVDFQGIILAPYGVHVNGMVTDATNRPQITIADGARIMTAEQSFSQDDSTPIYAAGTAEWRIGAATLEGNAAIGIRSGSLTFTNSNVAIRGNLTDNPSVSTGQIQGHSAVFQIEHNAPYTNDAELTINGGNYVSTNANVLVEYGIEDAEAVKIVFNNGTFASGTGKDIFFTQYDANITINGGTFTGEGLDEVAQYVAKGYKLNDKGEVVRDTTNQGGSNSGSSTNVIKNNTGEVSVEGNFKPGTAFLTAKLSAEKVTAFGLARYALYDINLTDAAGKTINPDGTVTVSIIVPKALNGEKCNVYYVSDDLKTTKKLDSTYKDGVISFKAEHFSYYAIVEDTDANGGNIISTPETGTIAGHGVVSAVSTMMPILMGTGVMFVLFGRKLIARRRAEAMAGVEYEIVADAKAIIAEAEAEPQIERFVATPMTAADEEEIKSHIFNSSSK